MAKQTYLYNDYVKVLSSRVMGELEKITSNHNFELGSEFEIALCLILNDVLPGKLGVCRGYVVNAKGETAGDDIIVFDRSRYPTLAVRSQLEFLRKEYVPVEAVYAYIEAKHTLQISSDEKCNIHKAIKQVADVRKLCEGRFSSRFEPNQVKDRLYGMIVARNMSGFDGNKNVDITDDQAEKEFANLRIKFPGPDCVVAGSNIVTRPRWDWPEGGYAYAPFVSFPDDYWCEPIRLNNTAFGCGIVMLMHAIEQITLGPMPWQRIVWNALSPDQSTVEVSTEIWDAIHEISAVSRGVTDFPQAIELEYNFLARRFDKEMIEKVLRYKGSIPTKPNGLIEPPEAETALQRGDVMKAI